MCNTQIKVAIIDDEPLAVEGLSNYVREVDYLDLIGTCNHPIELMQMLDQKPVDLIFLDIQTPKMNGIDYLKIAQNPPMVIITTAYPSYALEGFRLNVLDYLLKPIMFDRFIQATNKAKDYQQLLFRKSENQKDDEDDYFFVKADHKYEKIYLEEILYIQGMQNYVAIFTTKGKYVTLLNLKDIEQNLNDQLFIRVHKSYIIAVSKINSIESHEIKVQNTPIPLSRNYRDKLLKSVVHNKLWKK